MVISEVEQYREALEFYSNSCRLYVPIPGTAALRACYTFKSPDVTELNKLVYQLSLLIKPEVSVQDLEKTCGGIQANTWYCLYVYESWQERILVRMETLAKQQARQTTIGANPFY